MINAFTAMVFGRVQGVGFRFHVKSKAISLNLTGWVRNRPE
jgi:acylphosphatase